MKIITEERRKEIKEKLKSLLPGPDEYGHMEADDLLCDLLKELGFEDVVEIYLQINKWYA